MLQEPKVREVPILFQHTLATSVVVFPPQVPRSPRAVPFLVAGDPANVWGRRQEAWINSTYVVVGVVKVEYEIGKKQFLQQVCKCLSLARPSHKKLMILHGILHNM